jgi:hypothetical protein
MRSSVFAMLQMPDIPDLPWLAIGAPTLAAAVIAGIVLLFVSRLSPLPRQQGAGDLGSSRR